MVTYASGSRALPVEANREVRREFSDPQTRGQCLNGSLLDRFFALQHDKERVLLAWNQSGQGDIVKIFLGNLSDDVMGYLTHVELI